MKPVVIIDGNNLIKAKYPLGNEKIPPEIVKSMIDALKRWAQTESCLVELCLDPYPINPQRTKYLSLFVEREKIADRIVEERALLHAHNGQAFVVVTTDTTLLDTVIEIGATYVRSQDFLSGNRPDGFISLPHIPNPPPLISTDNLASSEVKENKTLGRTKERRDTSQELLEIHQKTLEAWHKAPVLPTTSTSHPMPEAAIELIVESATLVDPPSTDASEDRYTLNVSSWPIHEGLRFIIDCACPHHRTQLEAVLGETGDPSAQDVVTLLDLLKESCRDEPDFVSRSGSLMKKVKRALIKSDPIPLTFSQIQELIGGDISGMRMKIKKSIPVWLVKVTCNRDGQDQPGTRDVAE